MRFRFSIQEEGGAGEEGTKKLVKRYKKDTPGQKVDEKVYADSGLGKWFGAGGKGGVGKGGWDRYNTKGERLGKCGDGKPGEGTPKCLSANKARRLKAKGGKSEIANAVKRKKTKDPVRDKPGTGNKPVNVSNRLDKKESVMKLPKGYLTEKNKPTDPDKWDAAVSKAKSKFDVYPSAYANAYASKEYKAAGGSWIKESESVEVDGIHEEDPHVSSDPRHPANQGGRSSGRSSSTIKTHPYVHTNPHTGEKVRHQLASMIHRHPKSGEGTFSDGKKDTKTKGIPTRSGK